MPRKRDASLIPPVDVFLTIRGVALAVKVKATSIGNSGIGPYECHGRRGFDHGVDFVDEWVLLSIEPEDGSAAPVDKKEFAALIDADSSASDRIAEALSVAMGEAL